MQNLMKEYFDCCDRLYLNYLAQQKMVKGSKSMLEQIDKDEKLKKDLERILCL